MGGYYYKNKYYKTKEAAEKAKAKAEGSSYKPSPTPTKTSYSSNGAYNQTWEANGRTYVGGVDVGPAGTQVNTSNTTNMINQAIRDNNSGSGSSYTPTYEEPAYDKYQSKYDDLLSEYQAQQDYIREQQRKANEAAVSSGVERLQNQLVSSNRAFDEAGRNAYINAMKNQYALPNQLAAMGYTGGLSETEAARSRANYANKLADIEQQRALTTNETNLAINDLRNQADQRTAEQNTQLATDYINKIAELKAQVEADRMNDWKGTAEYLYGDDYTAEIQRLQADNADGRNSEKIAYLMALRQQKLNNQADEEEAEWNRKYKEAQLMADLGDYSGLKALGYNVTGLQQQNTAKAAEANQKANQANYDEAYKKAKTMWEDNNASAVEVVDMLAGMPISDEELERIIAQLGVKQVYDNLKNLGKI